MIAKTLTLAVLALSSTVALADADVQHDVDDYQCSSRTVPSGDVITECLGLDGVAHSSTSASGITNFFINGDTWRELYVNDDLVSESSRSGRVHAVNRDGETQMFHLDQCRTIQLPSGDTIYVDFLVQIAAGEIIYESVEEVDSCD